MILPGLLSLKKYDYQDAIHHDDDGDRDDHYADDVNYRCFEVSSRVALTKKVGLMTNLGLVFLNNSPVPQHCTHTNT